MSTRTTRIRRRSVGHRDCWRRSCRSGSRRTTAARPARRTRRSGCDLANERGLSYLLTAPGDLGMARAYVAGDLEHRGRAPGRPLRRAGAAAWTALRFRRPGPAEAVALLRGLGLPAPAAAGRRRRRRRCRAGAARRGPAALDGPRRRGDPPPLRRLQPVLRAGARPVDDLHLRGLPDRGRDARGGAGREVRPGRPQARPPARPAAARRRLRLGRRWSGTRPGSTASRRSASPCRASRPRGRRRPSTARASATSPRCGTSTTATSMESGFDAVSSIGLTEHIGVRNYPAYFAFLRDRLRPAGPAAQPLHHPAAQPARRRPARSSTATSSPTAS